MTFGAGFSRPDDGDTPFGILFNYERSEKYFQVCVGLIFCVFIAEISL